jgi:transcriptional regulator GlxA family with amidase domain
MKSVPLSATLDSQAARAGFTVLRPPRDETDVAIGLNMDSNRISQTPGAATEGMALAVESHSPALRREDPADRRGRSTSRLTQRQMRSIDEYIEIHLGDVIQTHHLSGAVNLSRSHFCRIFRLTVGTSPREYLLQLRLQRAKVLLQESSNSLCEIANICGFVDQSHLTRTFRKRLATTPGRWRKQSLSGPQQPKLE